MKSIIILISILFGFAFFWNGIAMHSDQMIGIGFALMVLIPGFIVYN